MWKGIAKKLKFTTESYISMFLGLLVVAVIGILIFNFFQTKKEEGKPAEGEVITGEETRAEEEISLPTTHKVAKGETLWTIAEKYFKSGYNWVDIAQENTLPNPDYIEVGQELGVPKVEKRVPLAAKVTPQEPVSQETYAVVRGDNLWNIALRAYGDGFAWTKIAEANKLANPHLIHAGNAFVIPR